MPITKLESGKFTHHCANCGHERDLALTDVKVDSDDVGAGDALRVPTCPKCNSVELLLTSRADAPKHPVEGSYGHLHQLLVDEVRERLRPVEAKQKQRDESELKKWFSDGLVLSRPGDFQRNPKTPQPQKDKPQ